MVDHCNLACAGCDHSSPFLPQRFASLEQFRRDVDALSSVLHVETLKIVGGEPLLHPQLAAFLEAARNAGLADEVELWTNGVLLHQADEGIFEKLDSLRLTIYPGVKVRFEMAEIERKAKRYGFRFTAQQTDEFMNCVVNTRIEDAALVERIFRSCKNSHVWSCHSFQDGRYYKCSRAPYIPKRLAQRGIQLDNPSDDGVPLYGSADLRGDLERYLADRKPLAACHWCLGTSGTVFPHAQLSAAARSRELAAEHPNPRSYLDFTEKL